MPVEASLRPLARHGDHQCHGPLCHLASRRSLCALSYWPHAVMRTGARRGDDRDAAFPPRQRSSAVEEVDVATLQRHACSDGALTAHALTQAYLERIAAIDDAGPTLNAVIELNPDALEEADALDAERKAGESRGPLHGIPCCSRTTSTPTPMINSAGSLALAEPPAEARRLPRRAAARGRRGDPRQDQPQRMGEFPLDALDLGLERPRRPDANPYALDRNPCGSSSGTGSAIAASLAAVGVGTETDGSIICPSSVTAWSASSRRSAWSAAAASSRSRIQQDTAGRWRAASPTPPCC